MEAIGRVEEPSTPRFEEKAFVIGDLIAKGGEAAVYQAKISDFGPAAFKNFSRSISLKDSKEIDILSKLQHPRIVQLFGITIDPYDRDCCSGYIMEHMQLGSLDNVIHDPKIIYNKRQIFSWIRQAADGIMYLHSRNIIHRDIKPNNLLLGNSLYHLKVGDFGFSREYSMENTLTDVGTCFYKAPEIHDSKQYGFPADVYSFAITVWEIIHRKKPYNEFFGTLSQHAIVRKVIKGQRPIIDTKNVEAGFKALLERGWHKEPSRRLSIKDFDEFAKETMEKITPSLSGLSMTNSRRILLIPSWKEYPAGMFLLSENRSQWQLLSSKLPKEVQYGGVASLNEELYIFGGICLKNKTYKLNKQMEWVPLADMNEPREYIGNSSLVFEGRIWTFGGLNRGMDAYLDTVEKYSPEGNEWIQMPSMKEKRGQAAAATFDGNIFVCGGTNGESLKSIEVFAPKENIWSLFVDLPSPRSGHALISNGGNFLYVIGGSCDAQKEWNTVWRINPNEKSPQSWTKLRNMEESRTQLTASLLGNEIFAIGGEGKKTIEVFNGESWSKGPTLPVITERHLAIVISPQLAAGLSSAYQIHCSIM